MGSSNGCQTAEVSVTPSEPLSGLPNACRIYVQGGAQQVFKSGETFSLNQVIRIANYTHVVSTPERS